MPTTEDNFTGPVSNDGSLFFITGATSVGKTHLAMEVAKKLNAEIINADAFQVYRGLEILSAAPSTEEQAAIPHHIVSCLEPSEEFNAAKFVTLVQKAIDDISNRGKATLIVGGNGLYVDALVNGLSPLPSADQELRESLDGKTTDELAAEYAKLDPIGAKHIDLQNRRRLIRAIEVCKITGEPYSSQRRDWSSEPKSQLPINGVHLTRDREELYSRINTRVESIFDRAVDEISNLTQPSQTAKQILGYREITSYLNKEISHDEAIEKLQQSTRRYAKRQITWFKNQTAFHGIEITPETDSISDRIIEVRSNQLA